MYNSDIYDDIEQITEQHFISGCILQAAEFSMQTK